jgi:DNA-binding protein Fis
MKTVELKQKLHEYIDNAEEKKLKAIYIMVEDEIEQPYNYLNDEDFMKELQRRASELETGTKKGVSWSTVKRETVKALRSA